MGDLLHPHPPFLPLEVEEGGEERGKGSEREGGEGSSEEKGRVGVLPVYRKRDVTTEIPGRNSLLFKLSSI